MLSTSAVAARDRATSRRASTERQKRSKRHQSSPPLTLSLSPSPFRKPARMSSRRARWSSDGAMAQRTVIVNYRKRGSGRGAEEDSDGIRAEQRARELSICPKARSDFSPAITTTRTRHTAASNLCRRDARKEKGSLGPFLAEPMPVS